MQRGCYGIEIGVEQVGVHGPVGQDVDPLAGIALGYGIKDNFAEAYTWLVHQYQPRRLHLRIRLPADRGNAMTAVQEARCIILKHMRFETQTLCGITLSADVLSSAVSGASGAPSSGHARRKVRP
jgi:hypothetical protein